MALWRSLKKQELQIANCRLFGVYVKKKKKKTGGTSGAGAIFRGKTLLLPQKMENRYLFHILLVEIECLFHFIALAKSLFRFSPKDVLGKLPKKLFSQPKVSLSFSCFGLITRPLVLLATALSHCPFLLSPSINGLSSSPTPFCPALTRLSEGALVSFSPCEDADPIVGGHPRDSSIPDGLLKVLLTATTLGVRASV